MDIEILKYEILNIGIKLQNIEDLDTKLEKILNKYYIRRINFDPYTNSKNALIRLLIEGEFPTVRQWDILACKEGYLSHITLEYATGLNWKQIEKELIREIRMELYD